MSDLLLVSTENRVRTLRMNNPRRLNGWTRSMLSAIGAALDDAARDDDVGAVVLTGMGRYYSAGADLSGGFELGHPRALRAMIVRQNYELFDQFIRFDKPILIAVNGTALGAAVTTSVLCDAIIAAEDASFSTPFARLGVPAEGCSTILFPRLFGEAMADRILGQEGYKPSAPEALEIGLVEWVVPPDELLPRAQAIAEGWIAEGRERTFRGDATRAELEATNARESEAVADAFLSRRFLMNQYAFLRSKKKRVPAMTFLALAMTRPLWGRLL